MTEMYRLTLSFRAIFGVIGALTSLIGLILDAINCSKAHEFGTCVDATGELYLLLYSLT